MNLARLVSACLMVLVSSAPPVLGQEIIECGGFDGTATVSMPSFVIPPKTAATHVIDVLVLVTQNKLVHETLAEARFRATEELAFAHLALVESGASTVQFRLVGVEAVSYQEEGDSLKTIIWVHLSPEAQELRERYGADLVTVDAFSGLSIAALGPGPNTYVSVVASGVFRPNLATRAHELGHNLGLRHNIEVDPDGGKEHGHRWCETATVCWKDVMAYSTADGTIVNVTIPRYSNPHVLYHGIPTGVVGLSEGAIFATEVAPIVAGLMPTVIPDPCVSDLDTMCLGANDRFTVEVTWRDFQGATGSGKVASADTEDSGLFWFFDSENWEILVKVLDGCGINDRFWVFFAATTTVEFEITVTDTKTGAVKHYTNALGQPADAVTDTSAFDTCN